jgi:hypothetical protein
MHSSLAFLFFDLAPVFFIWILYWTPKLGTQTAHLGDEPLLAPITSIGQLRSGAVEPLDNPRRSSISSPKIAPSASARAHA